MTGDHQEILRLATIVQEFNEAVAGHLEADPLVSQQLRDVLDQHPDLEDELAGYAVSLMEAAMAAGDTDDEAATAMTAACAIAFVNAFAGLIEKAGLENEMAPLFPQHERTQANVDAFNKINAPHIARLCL
jgi:hypothetical protein